MRWRCHLLHHLNHLCVEFLGGICGGRSTVHRDLGDLFVIVRSSVIVATCACGRGGNTVVESLEFLFICFVAVFPRSETSRKGLEANAMPLMPLVAARAGSREDETMVQLIKCLKTISVWLSVLNWSTTLPIVWAQKPWTSDISHRRRWCY